MALATQLHNAFNIKTVCIMYFPQDQVTNWLFKDKKLLNHAVAPIYICPEIYFKIFTISNVSKRLRWIVFLRTQVSFTKSNNCWISSLLKPNNFSSHEKILRWRISGRWWPSIRDAKYSTMIKISYECDIGSFTNELYNRRKSSSSYSYIFLN